MPKISSKKAAIQFLPYQQRWILDKSRFKICRKARQIGISFATEYEVTEDCIVKPNTPWFYLSTKEERAKDAINEIDRFAHAFKKAIKIIEEDFWDDDRMEKFKVLRVEFPNGSFISGMPGNPDTARGVHGNVVLDEFAFQRKPREIYKALFPVITRGYRIIILSSTNGKQGKFYDLWEHGGDIWSRHSTDIYQAIEQGLDIDIDELRRGLNDEDAWQQEYECKFLDEAHAWIPFDLIDAAEDRGASLELPENFTPTGPCYAGIDIGRSKDLTVIYLIEKIGDVFWTRAVIVLRNTPFRDQMAAIERVMPFVQRACIDKGVMGLPLHEELSYRWGSRIEGVQFHAHVKEDLATHLRQVYEDRRMRNPYDADLRADVHSIKKTVTSAGNIRFDAERSSLGHADRFWAQGLAVHASSNAIEPFSYIPIARLESAGLFDEEKNRYGRGRSSKRFNGMGQGGIW